MNKCIWVLSLPKYPFRGFMVFKGLILVPEAKHVMCSTFSKNSHFEVKLSFHLVCLSVLKSLPVRYGLVCDP